MSEGLREKIQQREAEVAEPQIYKPVNDERAKILDLIEEVQLKEDTEVKKKGKSTVFITLFFILIFVVMVVGGYLFISNNL